MKSTSIKWGAISAAVVLAASLVQASDSPGSSQQSQTSSQQSQTSTQQATSQSSTSQNSIRFSKLMDAKVTSQAGEQLGEVEDLLFNPSTGKVNFVVLGTGGVLGIGEKRVPVPWQAVNVQSEQQFSLNVDRKKLQSAPSLSRNYSELSSPDYSITIYRFYQVPVGGAESPGGTQQEQGTQDQDSSSSPDSPSESGQSSEP